MSYDVRWRNEMVVGLSQPSTPPHPNSQLRLELDKKSYFK